MTRKSRALDLIESVSGMTVLFVGDTIIDEYRYVTPLGKSPKENLIPVRFGTSEVFRGGVDAAANHARSFCARVDVHSSGPVTRKVRYVDATYTRKLFEVQFTEQPACDDVLEINSEVTVVTDFGHGALMSADVEYLCESVDTFLAVNAQTNAANIGFNLITKYPRADYIVIDEPEARLAARDRESAIESVMERLAEGRCEKMIVTCGANGAVGYDAIRGVFCHEKAFTNRVVDTMGAGDAFFAVTAPMAKSGDIEELLLIGNAAGAIKTQIVGHREAVQKSKLIEFLNDAR